MWQTHLGHVANASGSCCKRIWVMWQTHFGSCGKRILGPGGDTRQSRLIADTASYSAWKCPQNKDTYSARQFRLSGPWQVLSAELLDLALANPHLAGACSNRQALANPFANPLCAWGVQEPSAQEHRHSRKSVSGGALGLF